MSGKEAQSPIALLIANFAEAATGWKGKGKAASGSVSPLPLAPGQPYVLVGAPADISWLKLGGTEVEGLVVDAPSNQMADALLADEAAMEQLASRLRGINPLSLRFQVWTEGAERLTRRLSDSGIEFDRRDVPLVSGSTVGFWNTKRGGRELLSSVEMLRPCLPTLEYRRTTADAKRLLEGRRGKFVLKPDAALGGAGVRLGVSAAEIDALSESRQDGWVLESLAGDPETNVSPTVDLIVREEEVAFVGMGLQLLRDRVSYEGLRNLPQEATYGDSCIEFASAVGVELSRRGYRGPLNVDFVVTAEGRIHLVEINVRQSAPLETFVALRRRFGAGWKASSYLCETMSLPVVSRSATELSLPDGAGTDFAATLGPKKDSGGGQAVALLVASTSAERLASLRKVARELVVAKGPGETVAPTVSEAEASEPLLAGHQNALAKRMRKAAARYRAEFPLGAPDAITGSYPIPTNWNGQPETKVLAWFASPGCAWSLAGGCTMCNFSADEKPMTVAEASRSFAAHLDILDRGTRRIHLGPGGSFFDDREVPAPLRDEVLRGCSALPSLRSVGLETRPSLVTFKKLMRAIECLPDTVGDLTLGFGLECLDPLVREVAINKGYGTNHIDRAISVIERANLAQSRVRVDFEVYVLLKPLFLTERESIDEALRTIKWSFGRGATTVALFMNTIKHSTVQGYLANRQDLQPPYRYEAPYFRTAVEVLRGLPPTARAWTQVLGPQSGVLAEEQPRGCDLCTPLMLGAIMGFNFTRDSAILEEAARAWCPCRADWESTMEVTGLPLGERIEQGIEILEAAFPERPSRPESREGRTPIPG